MTHVHKSSCSSRFTKELLQVDVNSHVLRSNSATDVDAVTYASTTDTQRDSITAAIQCTDCNSHCTLWKQQL